MIRLPRFILNHYPGVILLAPASTFRYDACLRGRYFHSRRAPVTNARATQEYERAITLDSNYALAWLPQTARGAWALGRA